jgi:hypothetical protein
MEAYLNLHWKCIGREVHREAQASLEEFQKEIKLKLEILKPSPPIQPTTWTVPPQKKS